MDSSSSSPAAKQRKRDYICACGKAYFSNAAIFTHIKQKHKGNPPGPTIKPAREPKRKGRPPIKQPGTELHPKPPVPARETAAEFHLGPSESESIYQKTFQEITKHLSEIQEAEYINPQLWETVDTFKRMDQFIEAKPPDKFEYKGVCMGVGLSEFMRDTAALLAEKPWQFEQVLVVMILLLQYAIDENNSSKIIEEAPIEELVVLMNPFIRDHIADYAEYLGIGHLWMMKEPNMTRIFVCFFNWLKWKDYTSYCITLI